MFLQGHHCIFQYDQESHCSVVDSTIKILGKVLILMASFPAPANTNK